MNAKTLLAIIAIVIAALVIGPAIQHGTTPSQTAITQHKCAWCHRPCRFWYPTQTLGRRPGSTASVPMGRPAQRYHVCTPSASAPGEGLLQVPANDVVRLRRVMRTISISE